MRKKEKKHKKKEEEEEKKSKMAETEATDNVTIGRNARLVSAGAGILRAKRTPFIKPISVAGWGGGSEMAADWSARQTNNKPQKKMKIKAANGRPSHRRPPHNSERNSFAEFFFKFNIRLWITRLTGSSGFNKVLMGFQSTQSKPGGSPFHLYRYLFLFNSIASVHYWLDNDEVLDVFLLL